MKRALVVAAILCVPVAAAAAELAISVALGTRCHDVRVADGGCLTAQTVALVGRYGEVHGISGKVLITPAPGAHPVTQLPPSLNAAREPFGFSAPTLSSGSSPGGEGRFGILIYTATAGAQGTLGGLVGTVPRFAWRAGSDKICCAIIFSRSGSRTCNRSGRSLPRQPARGDSRGSNYW